MEGHPGPRFVVQLFPEVLSIQKPTGHFPLLRRVPDHPPSCFLLLTLRTHPLKAPFPVNTDKRHTMSKKPRFILAMFKKVQVSSFLNLKVGQGRPRNKCIRCGASTL